MKRILTASAAALALAAAATAPAQAGEASAATADVPQQHLEEARGLVKQFFTDLKGEL